MRWGGARSSQQGLAYHLSEIVLPPLGVCFLVEVPILSEEWSLHLLAQVDLVKRNSCLRNEHAHDGLAHQHRSTKVLLWKLGGLFGKGHRMPGLLKDFLSISFHKSSHVFTPRKGLISQVVPFVKPQICPNMQSVHSTLLVTSFAKGFFLRLSGFRLFLQQPYLLRQLRSRSRVLQLGLENSYLYIFALDLCVKTLVSLTNSFLFRF